MTRPTHVLAAAAALSFAALAAHAGDPAAGDPARGEALYARCQGCHSIDRNRIGPMHRGLFGREAGGVEGFDYSAALKQSGIVWDEATLDAFLTAPRKLVPGTRMTYAGVADPRERADLIAYLKEATK
jgi:cytochrome c